MAVRRIVSRRDLERHYPGVGLDEFVPTHWVELLDTQSREVIREDAVALGDPEGYVGVRYGSCPGDADPRYAAVPPDRWQCLERHGIVRARSVKYVPDYVRPADRLGYVYFMQSGGPGGPIKIGWSQDLHRRKAELQTANAHRLRVLGKIEGTLEDEAAFHARFAHLRMEAEWFRDAPEIHDFLRQNATRPIADPM